MDNTRWIWAASTCVLSIIFLFGCSSRKEAATEKASVAKHEDAAAEPALDKPFQLGNQIEKFDPPLLAELDKTAQWVDRPVLDGIDELRKKQQATGPPPVTVEEAVKMRNNAPAHPEDNKKILAALGRLPADDDKSVDYESTWVRHVGGDLKSSNPIFASSVFEAEYQSLTGLNEGFIISFDRDLNYFASKETIVSWQSSKDGLMDKVVFRDDLTWSDGKPLTAHDFEFAFQVVMSDRVPVLAVRQNLSQMKYVKAYDDRTLVIFHKEPFATNTENLANFPAFPKHVYEKSIAEDPLMAKSAYHANLEDHPVVAGPYELVSRVRNQEFVLRRRDSYYMHNGKPVRRKPYFKEIRCKVIEDMNTALVALKGGEIEEMELRAEHWKGQTAGDDFYARNTKVTAVEWTEFHFAWNLKSPFFADKRVRQAMSYAMDYKELVDNICSGLYQPCRGTFHPTGWMFPKNGPEPYHQDLKKAEALLDEAGWTDTDGDGVRDKEINGRRIPFEFTLLTYQTESGVQTATLMKTCLDQIGVVCNVKPTEFTVLVDSQQNHKFEAAMGGWLSGTDPDTESNIFATGEGRNYGNYSNKQVDDLFEKGRRELNRQKRAEIYGQIHNLLWEDQPVTWLFYRNAFYAFNKQVRGYNFAANGPFNFGPGIHGIFKAAAAP